VSNENKSASAVLTPAAVKKRTKPPSRTPMPLMEMGSMVTSQMIGTERK